MKTAYFRFYEELNDFLPPEKRKNLFEHKFQFKVSVKDMIESLGVPHTEIDMILVNGVSVDFNYIVKPDDKISVYPVFESFDISDVQHLRAKPLREPKFIADVHLGSLARNLRMMGIDTAYFNKIIKDELIIISLKEKRTILTKDVDLLKNSVVTHGYFVRSSDPLIQLKEVIARFHLQKEVREFTRCLVCNSKLNPVDRELINDKLPEKVKNYHSEFHICTGCNKIYWKGTHYENMRKKILSILKW